MKLETFSSWLIEQVFALAKSQKHQNILSWLIGKIGHVPLPSSILVILSEQYVRYYNINIEEMAQDLADFRTPNEFFVRAINPIYRPMDQNSSSIISPVDGLIQNYGTIETNKLIQAKGIDYSLEQLIPSSFSKKFRNGQFITLYLAPKDCHRVFAPVDGKIHGFTYVPGYLFPVDEIYASWVSGLYAINERLITYLQTDHGCVAMVKVGAYGTGSITTSYDASIRTNTWVRKPNEVVYPQPATINRGEHLATFNVGSTVILLFQRGTMRFDDVINDKSIKYGQQIGYWC